MFVCNEEINLYHKEGALDDHIGCTSHKELTRRELLTGHSAGKINLSRLPELQRLSLQTLPDYKESSGLMPNLLIAGYKIRRQYLLSAPSR